MKIAVRLSLAAVLILFVALGHTWALVVLLILFTIAQEINAQILARITQRVNGYVDTVETLWRRK